MKKFLLVLMFSALLVSGFGQSNLNVFAENGESITMTVDGSEAENLSDSKVRFEGIKGDFVQVRITFKDQFPEPIKKSLMIESNSEITVALKQNNKGAYVLRPVSTVPISTVVDIDPSYPVHLVEDINVIIVGEPINETGTAPVNEVVTTTTTSTTVSGSSPTSIKMGVGGITMDVNINDRDLFQNGESTTSTTTSTTTTTTSSSSSSSDYSPTPVVEEIVKAEIVKEEVVKCAPMLESDYISAKKSISKKSFADAKMTTAKQIIKANCVSTNQVVGIMGLFNFEDDKIEFAKAAYDKVTDPQNYYKVNDVFTFSSSIDELNEFLEAR